MEARMEKVKDKERNQEARQKAQKLMQHGET